MGFGAASAKISTNIDSSACELREIPSYHLLLPIRTMKSLSPLMLILCGLPLTAAESDFSALVHHWNFDEGHEWHRMAFPYQSDAKVAHDRVGALDLKIPGKDKDETWAPVVSIPVCG